MTICKHFKVMGLNSYWFIIIIVTIILGTIILYFGDKIPIVQTTNIYTHMESLLAMKAAFDKIFCNVSITGQKDFMKMKPPSFNDRFKNPCWYEGEKLLCLPYMLVIGVDKAGTTNLWAKINQHPDFVGPIKKALNWTPVPHNGSQFLADVENNFSPLANKLSMINGSSTLITGDLDVFLLEGSQIWPLIDDNIGQEQPVVNTADYIHHLNKNVKLFINLRNPIDRLWSEYLVLSHSVNRTAWHFHEIVERGVNLYSDCLQTRSVRSCMYDRNLLHLSMMTDKERNTKLEHCRFIGRNTIMLRNGAYHVFIKDYLKAFRRDQILIQRLEDIAKDNLGFLQRTYDFLGLGTLPKTKMIEISKMSPVYPTTIQRLNAGDMFEKTRTLLYEFYKPHNEQLAILLHDAKYNYGRR